MAPRLSEIDTPIDGWPVGPYRAFLSVADSDGSDEACSEVESFDVIEGRTTRVTFQARKDASLVPTTGFLRVVLQFESWELVRPWYDPYGLDVEIELLRSEEPAAFDKRPLHQRRMSTLKMAKLGDVANGNPVWGWDAGEYPVGRFRLRIDPIRAWVDFDVHGGRITELDKPISTMAVLALDFGRGIDSLESLSTFLSLPEEWGRSLEVNDSPLWIVDSPSTARLISPPGNYKLAFAWGAGIKEYELKLAPGWNSLQCGLGESSSAVIAFVDGHGSPMAWNNDHWKLISFQSAEGLPLRVVPTTVRRKGIRGVSEGVVDLPHDGRVTILVSPDFEFKLSQTELLLEHRARVGIVVH